MYGQNVQILQVRSGKSQKAGLAIRPSTGVKIGSPWTDLREI